MASYLLRSGHCLLLRHQGHLPAAFSTAATENTESAVLSSLLLRCLDIPAPPITILNSATGLGGGGSTATGSTRDKAVATNEKMVFELRLEGFNAASKIKKIQTFTNLGLKEAKELVEKAPAVIKGGLSKEEAEGIIKKMKAIGT